MDDDESTPSPGVLPPPGGSAPTSASGTASSSGTPGDEPPGLRSQLGATVGAGKRLLGAHVDLAKAELSDIAGSVGRMVGLFAGAFVLLLFAGVLVFVGGVLFLGEWLFGSIGWGVLLGTLLFIDIAVVLALLALDVAARRVAASFFLAVVVGVVVGVLLALNLTNRGWTALGDQVAAAYDPSTRTVLLAIGISALVLGVLGFIAGIRNGIGSAIGMLIAGAIAGVVIGGITVIAIPGQAGAAIGVLVGLIVWPVLAGRDLARGGLDGESLKKKFMPEETINLTKETIEWVRARTPLVPKS